MLYTSVAPGGTPPEGKKQVETRRSGVHSLGLGVDPLTFAADILTVAVFDSDVFDRVFAGLVAANAEGRVIGLDAPAVPGVPGVPFTGEAIRRLAEGSESMQAAGAAVLQLAWQHRGSLLG